MSNRTFRLVALITIISVLIATCGGEEPTPTPQPAVTPTAVPTTAATEPAAESATAQATQPLTESVAATTSVATIPTVTETSVAATTDAMTATVALENLTYQSEYTQDGTATLVDGQYREAAAPGSATEIVVTLTDQRTSAELNGEPAAAVVLVTEPGGSGTFYYLAVVTEQDGVWTNVASILLGDRVQVNSVAINDNLIWVDMVTHGPDDPLCCPTQQVVQSYGLEGDQLVLADTKVLGTVAATTSVTSTQDVTATAPALTATATVAASEAVTASAVVTEPSSAQEPGQLTVVSVRATSEIVNEQAAAGATVSPDGANLAWIQSSGRGRNRVRQLCLFTFANADKVCYEAPEAYEGYPYTLAWSPDSAWIAFTENPIQLGYESDIWLFNRSDGAFVNRTDDGVTGSYVDDDRSAFFLDYLPMWSKSTGELYFWRTQLSGNFTISLALYRMQPDAGEPELVRDVTDTFSTLVPWFDMTYYFMDGVSALAPDAGQVALIVRSYDSLNETASDGLWLVDLTEEQAPPRQLATREDFQAAVPVWLSLPAVPLGLSWTADGTGVVAIAISNDSHLPLRVFYHFDISNGGMTPVVDFSDIPDMETFHTDLNEAGMVPREYSPWTATLSPAGDQLLMVNDLGGILGLLVAPLPPTGDLPELIYKADTPLSFGESRSSSASDGKVVAYSLMFTLAEE